MNNLSQQLSNAVVSIKAEEVKMFSQYVLDEDYAPEEAIEKGLAVDMNEVGKFFASKTKIRSHVFNYKVF